MIYYDIIMIYYDIIMIYYDTNYRNIMIYWSSPYIPRKPI